jgi:hypothetical protein
LSPGDVESISSDGEIGDSFDDNDLCNGAGANSPVNEPVLEQSPAPSTPDQDLEQYEPILSDEDIDDAEVLPRFFIVNVSMLILAICSVPRLRA